MPEIDNDKRFLILLNVIKRIAADKNHYLCICKDACELAEQAMQLVSPIDEEVEMSYKIWKENDASQINDR